MLMQQPRVSLIAAIGRNRELGKGNDLLWKIPDDLKRFRALTDGHPIIMGRKTYESLPVRPLPRRANIVVTRDAAAHFEGAVMSTSIEDALCKARFAPGADEIFVIGGGQIYEQALPYADRLCLTLVDAEANDAEVFFPAYGHLFTKVISDEPHEWHALSYRWVDVERD